MFVVFEGIDGSGKSTLAKAVQQKLAATFPQLEIILTAEPTKHLPVGQVIRKILQQNDRSLLKNTHFVEYMSLLMATDRQQHFWQEIAPALQRKALVLCDRFVWSSYAYQSAGGMNMEWLLELNRRVPIPDLTILIKLDLGVARDRMEASRGSEELFEESKMLSDVMAHYYWMAEQKTGIGIIDHSPLLTLDGQASIDQMVEAVCARLKLEDSQKEEG